MKFKWLVMLILLAALTGCIVAPAPPPGAYYGAYPYGYRAYYPYNTYYYPAPAYAYPLPGYYWGYRGGYWGHYR
jgi:hypothetical protein